MADEPHVIRGINWRETFPFTNLFRTFRIAVHPSKLALALAALLAIYLGGRILDAIWMSPENRVVPGEIAQAEARLFGKADDAPDLDTWRKQQREQATSNYAMGLRALSERKPEEEYKKLSDRKNAELAAKEGKYVADVRYMLDMNLRKALNDATEEYKKAEKKDAETLRRRDSAIREAMEGHRAALDVVDAVQGKGPFISFFEYETRKIDQVVWGVFNLNMVGPGGALWGVAEFFTVPLYWGLTQHWLYTTLFIILFMVVWSVFGGAIARIAAVHVADEGRKLSIRQGLSFSISKFLSFVSAPLIPLIIAGVIGLFVAAVALVLFLIRVDILVGIFFFLALLAGFVITLVLLGTIGGLSLMYPTIAVEGSDSFDAISRSFSYVYAKPWRMAFYSLVALIYGALTFLFVRLFIWLVLALTQFFVGWFVGFRTVAGEQPLWDQMLPPPQFGDLPYHINFALLNGYGDISAWFVALWVYILIALLGAFAISFYLSANTIIYYLMRREVDATEMDDVYLEQPEDDFVETPAAEAPATTTTTSTPESPAAPPAPEPPPAAPPQA